ncbi:hypothetical protein [Vibrio crassostreae]|uniref:hypothetical protein n=1 Tax=Vibrio crassostreae TaxID=246167 RepID=UPI001B30753F|nr:hypothetical protein [Vibrio crassostreae]
MYAETNITLCISFECPHCDRINRTSDHGMDTDITVSTQTLTCPHCDKEFELNINAA